MISPQPSALLILLAASAVAYDGTVGAGGPPGDYTEEEYSSFFNSDSRNASGIVRFDGYNVSEAFPPNETITGWAARIEVAPVDFEGDEAAYPGTRISFEAPDDVTLPGNDSDWKGCVSFFPPDWMKKSVRRKEGDEDNSCSFLSDDCQRALEATANGYFWYEGGCTGMSGLPEECEGHSSDGFTAGGFEASNFSSVFNGSTILSWRPDLTGPEAMSEDEAYDVAVGGYWTILVNWGRRDPGSFSTDEVPQGSVICLKADTLENDSEGAGIKPVADALLVFATTLLTVSWMMY